MIKYGKSAGPILGLKKAFFEDNDRYIERQRLKAAVYMDQPLRECCKNCDMDLKEVDFIKSGISYHICDRCGHLNGGYQDTQDFCEKIYVDDGGQVYSENYHSSDFEAYENRVNMIYQPKAHFLKEALEKEGKVFSDLAVSDIGCGSGYFVSALLNEGVGSVKGYEVSEAQVRHGNAMMSQEYLVQHRMEELLSITKALDTEVVSLIGVLEHLMYPRDMLKVISMNKNIKYFYLSVPLYSPTVLFELVFPDVFHRQLSGAHTHLYTESSIDWFCQEFQFSKCAEWWFGTDFIDLYRNVSVMLNKKNVSDQIKEMWKASMSKALDTLQIAFDKNKLSSEVHMLLRND